MLSAKIKSQIQLKHLADSLRKRGKKIVFTNGCFDILHFGHAKYLEEAKKKGDILVVAVNSDASIKRIKGKMRPVVKQKDRVALVAALESVDYVTVFNDDTPIKVIKLIRPDILIKGADWSKFNIVGADFVGTYGASVQTVRLVKGISTTRLIKKIAQKF